MVSRTQRHKRIRSKVVGTADRPRLSVFRSNKYVFLQLIDDSKGKTLASVRSDSAFDAGKTLAEMAKKKNIKEIVFDRGGYVYGGRIKQVADGAREGGLKF
ncbi:MAG: 50S ribosomal protein L18 [Patescibacteria group bacterium]